MDTAPQKTIVKLKGFIAVVIFYYVAIQSISVRRFITRVFCASDGSHENVTKSCL